MTREQRAQSYTEEGALHALSHGRYKILKRLMLSPPFRERRRAVERAKEPLEDYLTPDGTPTAEAPDDLILEFERANSAYEDASNAIAAAVYLFEFADLRSLVDEANALERCEEFADGLPHQTILQAGTALENDVDAENASRVTTGKDQAGEEQSHSKTRSLSSSDSAQA